MHLETVRLKTLILIRKFIKVATILFRAESCGNDHRLVVSDRPPGNASLGLALLHLNLRRIKIGREEMIFEINRMKAVRMTLTFIAAAAICNLEGCSTALETFGLGVGVGAVGAISTVVCAIGC